MNAKKTQGPGAGEAIYGGLAIYGKINVIIGTVISSIIVLGLLIFGAKLRFSKETQTKMTSGTVTNVIINSSNNSSANYTTYTIQYSVDGKQYAVQGSGKGASNGQTLNVLYNPDNPADARPANQMSNHTIGSILLVIAVVVGLLSGLTLYFTLKYKEFAAIEGGMTAAGQLGNIIRG